ncbi:hypothetical protein VTK73DRAFT_5946 [Phialemonium thermophilum]|uniref:Uncharacterized protein n=1 Tax=Phialemonium thermophilum TaxID=223376 RepID=A0ABR3V0V1_9PEZI
MACAGGGTGSVFQVIMGGRGTEWVSVVVQVPRSSQVVVHRAHNNSESELRTALIHTNLTCFGWTVLLRSSSSLPWAGGTDVLDSRCGIHAFVYRMTWPVIQAKQDDLILTLCSWVPMQCTGLSR